MADTKSREDFVNVIHQCLKCGSHHVIPNGVDGITCDNCGGQLKARGLTNLPITKPAPLGTFRVDIDCSDALKGLKAVQREARKATQALKELEEQQKKIKGTIRHKSINDIRAGFGLKPLDDKVADVALESVPKPCPKCNSNNVESIKLYAGGTKPMQIINKCIKCEWTYNE